MADVIPDSMPRTDTDKMIEIKFSVPGGLLEDALEMAAIDKMNPAQFHRMAWERGLSAYAEGSNKRLINRKLRKASEVVAIVEGLSGEKLDEAIALLKQLTQ